MHSVVLKEYIAHFSRARTKQDADGDYNLAYMRRSMEAYMRDERNRKNLQVQRAEIAKGSSSPAYPVVDGGSVSSSGTSRPRGGDDGKDKPSKSERLASQPCWTHQCFLHRVGPACPAGDKCPRNHRKIGESEFKALAALLKKEIPQRARSSTPARSPKGKGSGKNKKGKSKRGSSREPSAAGKGERIIGVCFEAVNHNGRCDKTDCPYSHDAKRVQEERRKKEEKKNRKGGRAKGEDPGRLSPR